jgi:hypothetical protein
LPEFVVNDVSVDIPAVLDLTNLLNSAKTAVRAFINRGMIVSDYELPRGGTGSNQQVLVDGGNLVRGERGHYVDSVSLGIPNSSNYDICLLFTQDGVRRQFETQFVVRMYSGTPGGMGIVNYELLVRHYRLTPILGLPSGPIGGP